MTEHTFRAQALAPNCLLCLTSLEEFGSLLHPNRRRINLPTFKRLRRRKHAFLAKEGTVTVTTPLQEPTTSDERIADTSVYRTSRGL